MAYEPTAGMDLSTPRLNNKQKYKVAQSMVLKNPGRTEFTPSAANAHASLRTSRGTDLHAADAKGIASLGNKMIKKYTGSF